ncbi:MAG: hypothetical protein K2J96_06810, partial [Bacteroidaceae bacterium]|nr:hypothetical protein [Bacteroidaceae bacterium]
LGLLARKYRERFFALISDARFSALLLVGFVGAMCALLSFDLLRTCPPLGMLSRHLVVRYCGLLIVFTFFFRHRDFFAAGSRIGRAMQFVGRRTLDIYLLHYFLIHHSPAGGLFERIATGPIVVCLCGVGCYTLLVIGLCLLLSETLRNSPLLARYLFGVQQPSGTSR